MIKLPGNLLESMMKYEKAVVLEKGRDKLAKNHNPWVYSGAVRSVSGNPQDGDIVAVLDLERTFVAWAHYNGRSGIALRLLEWESSAIPDYSWLKSKISEAYELRKKMVGGYTNVFRLIYSESDMLPGIICDVYGSVAVLQISTPGFDRLKLDIAEILTGISGISSVYEKSDGDGRKIEGLAPSTGWIKGGTGSTELVVKENGLNFFIDLSGQKTGFYADQRENRLLFGKFATGEVLDMCSFSGAFSIHALKNGANHVTLCDISKDTARLIDKNMELNDIAKEKYDFIAGDAFEVLRNLERDGRKFDSIVLDPPKLVPSNKYLEKGLKAYKDLNFNALKLIRAGGILATFSCSGAVTMADFKNAVAYAAKDAKKELKILNQMHQPFDHPVRMSAPETEYLKGLLLKVC